MNISMRNLIYSPLVAWIGAAIVGFFYLFTFVDFRPQLRPDRINFGIDLVGGTYITLEVETNKAIEAELADRLQIIIKKLNESKNELPVSQNVENQKIILTFKDLSSLNSAVSYVKGIEPELNVVTEGTTARFAFRENDMQKIREWAIKGNIDVLRARLDDFGVGEISIAQVGKNIVVELPNVKDPQKAKERIGTTALLEIKLVEREAPSEEALKEMYDWEIPEGMEIVPDKSGREYYLVPKHTDLTGRLLKDSFVGFGGDRSQNEIAVWFKFKPAGGDKFYALTSKNYGRNIAIIVDGKVISAPRVNMPISSEGYIHGNFTAESASELAKMLKSGAFIAPVKFIEERQIGPSLGAESIHRGLIACLVGLLLLAIFSVFMYKIAGVFALLALFYNLFLILLALSFLRATLTLPGIAGMVLTVGMAIDASILIYEKIREELAGGTPLKKAINSGFSDAMQVILDSNITTFLVGIVLYKFGVGPIQGFAVTMMVGIISTLLTGLFFLRSIFNFCVNNLGVQKIKI